MTDGVWWRNRPSGLPSQRPVDELASKQLNRKDTVPPQKSQTRGKALNKAQEIPKPGKRPEVQKVAAPKRAPAKPAVKSRPIPSAQPSHALTAKHPKPKDPEKLIHNRLKKKSPWYQSILDPLHGADAKIPDETGVETGTCQLVERFTISTGTTAGMGGIRILTPYINNAKHNEDQITSGSNIQYVKDTATETSIEWGSHNGVSAAWLAGSALPFESVDGLRSITNAHRIVSACLIVQPEVSLADNEGEYCLFLNEFSVEESPDYNDYVNNYKSVTIPMSANNNVGVVRWYPVARNDWNFKSFIRTDGVRLENDDREIATAPLWSLGVIFNAKVGVASRFRVTVVVNYEFIPANNVLNVLDTSPSPQDTMEVDLVERWVQDAPLATPMSPTKAASSPSSVEPEQGSTDEGTGFGMFFNVLSELVPFALALL